MVGLFLVTFVPNVVGEFIALEPTDYKHHFLEGWPGPWQNGSGVDNINIRLYSSSSAFHSTALALLLCGTATT